MRLIDADALKERIIIERDKIPLTKTERYSLGAELPYRHGQSMRGGIRKALRCMEQTPTIEALPVKHGRWVHSIEVDADWVGYKCSECCEFGAPSWNYCPNCGAKMKEDDDE